MSLKLSSARVLVLRVEQQENSSYDAWTAVDASRPVVVLDGGRASFAGLSVYRALSFAVAEGCPFLAFPWGASTREDGAVEFYAASTAAALAAHVAQVVGRSGIAGTTTAAAITESCAHCGHAITDPLPGNSRECGDRGRGTECLRAESEPLGTVTPPLRCDTCEGASTQAQRDARKDVVNEPCDRVYDGLFCPGHLVEGAPKL